MDRMIDAQAWLERRSWWVVLVASVVIWGGILTLLWNSEFGLGWSAVMGAIGGILFAVAMLWARSRLGASPEARAQISKAQRSGQVPDGIDPELWMKELGRRERQINDRPLFQLIFFFALGAANIWASFESPHRTWFASVGVILFVTGTWSFISKIIALPRVVALQRAIREAYPLVPSWY